MKKKNSIVESIVKAMVTKVKGNRYDGNTKPYTIDKKNWLPGMKKAIATLEREIQEGCRINKEIRGIFQKMTPDDYTDLLQVIGYSDYDKTSMLRLQQESGSNYEIVIHERFMCYLVTREIAKSKCYSCKYASKADYDKYGWLKCNGCVKHRLSAEEISSLGNIFGKNKIDITMNRDGDLFTEYCIHTVNHCENYKRRLSTLVSDVVRIFIS